MIIYDEQLYKLALNHLKQGDKSYCCTLPLADKMLERLREYGRDEQKYDHNDTIAIDYVNACMKQLTDIIVEGKSKENKQ